MFSMIAAQLHTEFLMLPSLFMNKNFPSQLEEKVYRCHSFSINNLDLQASPARTNQLQVHTIRKVCTTDGDYNSSHLPAASSRGVAGLQIFIPR